MRDDEDDQILEGLPGNGGVPVASKDVDDDARRVTPDDRSHAERSRSRDRDKGFDFPGGGVINRDGKPLGRPVVGRSPLDVPVVMFDVPPKDELGDFVVRRLDQALEINARVISAYIVATRDRALTAEIHSAIDRLPHLDAARYEDAVRCMTNFRSTEAHGASIAETATGAVRDERHIRSLCYALLVREALDKGRAAAAIRCLEEKRFVHDNVRKNQLPSEAVLSRTFIPDALKDKDDRSCSSIKEALARNDASKMSSDISYDELVVIAYYALINPYWIYMDFSFLDDLFELTVFSGRAAYGFREMMDKQLINAYRTMLCGGEDAYPDPEARPARAHVAALVRARWRLSPYLVRWSRYQGRLMEP